MSAAPKSETKPSSTECKEAHLNVGVAKVSVKACTTKNSDGSTTKTVTACSSKGLSVAPGGASSEKCTTTTTTTKPAKK